MEPKGWHNYRESLESLYYTEIVVILSVFFLFYVAIKSLPHKNFAPLFFIYALTCMILFPGMAIQRIFFPLNGRPSSVYVESMNTIFAILELYVFIIFFFQILESKTFKKILLLFCGAFIIAVVYFVLIVLDLNSDQAAIMDASLAINILEFLIFLIAILSYFVELFTKPPTQELTKSPTFWISSGLFIYVLVSLPFLLVAEYSWTEKRNLYYFLSAIHFLSLSLLLFTISKALICQDTRTS